MPETCAGHAWEDAKYNAQSYTQYSDLTRDPWFVAPGAQRNPHLNSWWENAALTLAFTTGVPTRNPQAARYRVVSACETAWCASGRVSLRPPGDHRSSN